MATAPSQHRYQLITTELEGATSQLEAFRLMRDLEAIEGPGKRNLLDWRYPPAKNREVPRKVVLAQKIESLEAVVASLEGFLAEWNAQDEAFHAEFDQAEAEAEKPKLLKVGD